MPYKDPEKQREAMRKIMRKRYKNAGNFKEILRAVQRTTDREEQLFYLWFQQRKGEVIAFGVALPEQLDFLFRKGSKLGTTPDEMWICRKLSDAEGRALVKKTYEKNLREAEQ